MQWSDWTCNSKWILWKLQGRTVLLHETLLKSHSIKKNKWSPGCLVAGFVYNIVIFAQQYFKILFDNTVSECPLGYSKEGQKDQPFCWPNICTCDNGIPALTNYDHVQATCGFKKDYMDNLEYSEMKDSNPTSRIYKGDTVQKHTWPFTIRI